MGLVQMKAFCYGMSCGVFSREVCHPSVAALSLIDKQKAQPPPPLGWGYDWKGGVINLIKPSSIQLG